MKEKTKGIYQSAKSTYKNIDWVFFWVLLISLISPFIYKFLKLFFVSFSGIDILSTFQVESSFSNLLYETLSIFVIIPIYAFVNRKTKTTIEKKEKFLISLFIGIVFAIILFLLISLLGIPFSIFLLGTGQQQILLFVSLGIGFSLILIYGICTAFLVIGKNKRGLLISTFASLFIYVVVDIIFLSGWLFEINFVTLALSIIIAPILNVIMISFLIFFKNKKERVEWKIAFNNFSWKKWKSDLKVYKKTSLFSGIETGWWNLMWFFGIMMPFIIMGNRLGDTGLVSGAMLADSLFWVVLVIPLTAATYLQAEKHSHDAIRIEHNQKIKEGFLITGFIALIWLILGPLIIIYLYPILLKNANSPNAIMYAQHLSWIMFGFYFFMLITRVINSYWSTTNQSFKTFMGTVFACTISWMPIGIIFLVNPNLISEPWVIALMYGVGLMLIALFNITQLILENIDKVKLPNWYMNLAFLEEPINSLITSGTEFELFEDDIITLSDYLVPAEEIYEDVFVAQEIF